MQRYEISNTGINADLLQQAAQANPQYTKLFAGLYRLHDFVKHVAEDTILNNADNPSAYYLKAEVNSQSYSLYIFNAERNATAGTLWPIGDFLTACETKTIEFDTRMRVTKMIRKLGESNLTTGSAVNWITT